MRLNFCLIVLLVSNFAALLLIPGADSEDSNCETEIRVRRNTHRKALLGQRLVIDCPVHFCINSTPTVSWFKLDKTAVPADVSSGSHIKTEWKQLNHSDGISHLIFQNILMSDSGVYRCHSDVTVSHSINVSVYGNEELTTDTEHDYSAEIPLSGHFQDSPRPNLYRVIGIVVFVIIVIIMHVTSKSACKGVHCARRSRETPDPSPQPSDHALPVFHIYENDQ
ncbi:uncharacterized protein LOC121627203 [Chelmon rostratus]|uniref:uncharacterized protein LOC121627203 n=1 Tax=Chelmon rostratus TaxID=109905 RepID=UPI001BEBC234|nr:uncharacterized protein LOC121627203 [Chelmon rostratus]